MIVVRKDCEKILTSIFKDEDIAFVPYKTPGIELALELNKVLKNFKIIPKIIFLQNHGLIVTSPNKPDIKVLTEQVLEKIEAYLKLDMSKYKLTNKISHLLSTLQKTSNITFLSEDSYLNKQLNKNKELFLQTPFSPDSLVFCGVSAIEIEDLFDISPLEIYKAAYFELPKIIIFSNKLFLIAPNTRKAKEMEEVLKFHIMVLEKSLMNDKNFLAEDELAYLNNWEAEKYRQKL
jgi:rhamnose utilization protein RhaD (predicted bifunctional aldolase and dehydrogenase)